MLWGGLHGLYLMMNHAFRAACAEPLLAWVDRSRVFAALGWLLTMLAVVVAWVFFRAETLGGAGRMLSAMAVPPTLSAPPALLWNAGLQLHTGLTWCAVLAAVAFLAPNSGAMGSAVLALARGRTAVRDLVTGAGLCLSLLLVIACATRDATSAFIYFNF